MTNDVTISRNRIWTEFIVLTLALVAAWYAFTAIVYPAWGLEGDSPVPARTIVAIILIAIFLKLSGEQFRDIGFFRPKRIWLAVVLGFLILVLHIAVLNPAIDFLTARLEVKPFDYAFFQHMVGNELALAAWLGIAWTTAAFGEEIFFRGYLIHRLTSLFGGGAMAVALAVLGQAVLFGLGHAYQGPGGALSAGLFALMVGIIYLLIGRNLWPLIIAHGLYDTIGLTLIYLNGSPTTG